MDSPTAFRMFRFSTDEFPESKRVEAYREIFSRTIIRFDMESIGDRPFHFESTLCGMPSLGLASSLITPCRRWHGAQHVDGDDFILGIGLSGRCVVQQCGREAVIGDGEAVLTGSGEPADVLIPTTSRAISLRLPGAVLRKRIGDIEARLARRIPHSHAPLSLLKSYLGAICSVEGPIESDLREIVVPHVCDLVSLILGAQGEAGAEAEKHGGRAARRAAILHEIARRSGDAGLNAESVAAQLHVTPRYVHLLLEETGKSFTHHVLAHRLEAAAALLRDPLWRDRKIAEIAAKAGFGDLSYFNRSFRRHFGAAPSDMRESADRD